MDTAKYVEALVAGAEQMGIEVSADLASRLAAHQALVEKWAKRINLTTVRAPEDAAIRHGLDCLLFHRVIPADDLGLTVDVGSGGGYPGLIMALAQPARPMVLLEPIRKRASFLRTAAAELALDRVRVVEGRLEPGLPVPDPRPRAVPWPVPRIVSRATIPPLELVPLAAPYLAPGGTLVLTAGAGAPEPAALAAVAAAAGLRHAERFEFHLPGGLTRVLDRLEVGS